MASSRWPENNGSSGVTVMTRGDEDKWQQGVLVMERGQGGGGSKENGEADKVTHTERHMHSPATRLGAEVATDFGDEDRSGDTMIFRGRRWKHAGIGR